MANSLINEYIKFSSNKDIILKWEYLFKKQLELWGFNHLAQNTMFKWGEHGHNWEKLWVTDKEKQYDSKTWRDKLYNEIEYCSDRMSLDRLLRCHWLYNQYTQALFNEK